MENYYFNQITFLDYFDRIVQNYREKIPFVFGEWNTLKELLKNYAIYNFDLIIDPNNSFQDNNLSISLGGSKELYNGIKEIILHTHQQIGEFVNIGSLYEGDFLFNKNYSNRYSNRKIQNNDYLSTNSLLIQEQKKGFNNFFDLKLKIIRYEKILNPLEMHDTNRRFDRYNRTSSEIEVYEEMFAVEISAMYYFNLHNTNYKSYLSLDDKTYKQISEIKPKTCLSQIRKADNEINNFYLRWKNDIITFYENTLNNINNLFD